MALNSWIKLVLGDEERSKPQKLLPPEGTEWFKLIQKNQEERKLKDERKRQHYMAKRQHELDLYRRIVVTDED